MMSVIGPLLTLAIVLAVRLRRQSRERPLSLRFFWLAPALYLAAVAVVLAGKPPTPLGWALLGLGLVLGLLAGWLRGRLFRLRVDDSTGAILLRRSRWAVTMLVALVSLRFLANLWLGEPHEALLVTDLMLGLVLGLLVATRVAIARRANQLPRPDVERGGEAL